MNTKDYSSCVRGFHWVSRAWYGSASLMNELKVVDSITIGFYDVDDGGTIGEFSINWEKLGGETVLRLDAFNDSWGTFAHFADLLGAMAKIDEVNVTPEKFVEILTSFNIADLTKYTRE